MSGPKFALAVAGVAAAAAVFPPAGAPSTEITHRACFGAASHDPERACHDSRLRKVVVPSPQRARGGRNAPCTIVLSRGPFRVCSFGAAEDTADQTIALIGDSHAAHWRAALEVVARRQNWHGMSITLSGCPFSAATRVLREPLRGNCVERNRQVPDFLAHHPEIRTIFVSELSGAQWLLPHASDEPFRGESEAYVHAWRELPSSVQHVLVIRDTPKAQAGTESCVEHTMKRNGDPGTACAVPRREALDRDAAVAAAAYLGPPRFQAIDMTPYFCDARVCLPVIGGALVQKDLHHLTRVFVTTLGPYLLREVRKIGLAR